MIATTSREFRTSRRSKDGLQTIHLIARHWSENGVATLDPHQYKNEGETGNSRQIPQTALHRKIASSYLSSMRWHFRSAATSDSTDGRMQTMDACVRCVRCHNLIKLHPSFFNSSASFFISTSVSSSSWALFANVLDCDSFQHWTLVLITRATRTKLFSVSIFLRIFF